MARVLILLDVPQEASTGLVESITARVEQEAGYLENGAPIQPTSVVVSVVADSTPLNAETLAGVYEVGIVGAWDLNDEAIIKAVREELAEVAAERVKDDDPFPGEAVKVEVGTSEWDNGYFLDPEGSAHVTFSDGTEENTDLGGLRDILTDYGARYALGRKSWLIVDLVKNTVEVD